MAAGTGILWMTRQHKFAPQISQIITDLNMKISCRENKFFICDNL
ncbi:hypothetical protein M123_2916 [Bacteroides fragilis str. 3976T8]|uniref:Uncharacterized protein n=1 Tax=Bacteroides fragilis str. 3976T8 TaxID=1339314 RepID=A0A016E6D4_BACFG|nr:hypothetical protein M072_2629 [Bacteroides fragilis str. DS-208]EXZ72681.1 hypothetical protein M123_2916 [Bacteroides fragilis str. 3976T8]